MRMVDQEEGVIVVGRFAFLIFFRVVSRCKFRKEKEKRIFEGNEKSENDALSYFHTCGGFIIKNYQ